MTTFPAFFEQVPGITVHDPLADLLGAAQGGLVHYGYADAVRLAGHSCPTVASAYWLGGVGRRGGLGGPGGVGGRARRRRRNR